ncbi:endonuclease/exonuclease/phosphatase family protein [Micromonospora rubida]
MRSGCSSNTGFCRELDDLDSRCVGYGETTVGAGSTGGLCGLGNKIDLIFVRENRLAGSYTADSLAIPTTCTIGACSDHRVVTGTVTVSIN